MSNHIEVKVGDAVKWPSSPTIFTVVEVEIQKNTVRYRWKDCTHREEATWRILPLSASGVEILKPVLLQKELFEE